MKSIFFIVSLVAMPLAGCASKDCAEATAEACCNTVAAIPDSPQALTVVDSLEPIKAAFNAHIDKPRVVLLVSPACSECVLGAQAVRKSIMERFAASGVHPIVVWLPMVESDSEAAAAKSSGIFAETNAVQFYDPERLAGWAYQREQFSTKWDQVEAALPAEHWLRQAHDRKPEAGPEWDVYMLYKPGARWETTTPKADAFIRHIGRDQHGQSHYFRDGFNQPPSSGDLYKAMDTMGKDILGSSQGMNIELLGFPGCPNTPEMRKSLTAALKSIDAGLTFKDVDQETLTESDIRRGWATPTILVNGKDLFGMPQPATAAMGCRLYPDGVPDATTVAEALRTVRSVNKPKQP